MSIQEKMAALEAEKQAAKEAERKRREEEKATRSQRYTSELPQALERQRELFNELEAMGIVRIVEKMIDPQKLRPHNLSEEQYQPHNGSLWASPGKTLPGPLRQTEVSTEGVKKALNNMQKQEWAGEVLPPEQLDDGSISSTLRIEIHNDTLKRKSTPGWGGPIKAILISYSEQGVLRVSGKRPTFGEDIRSGFDIERFETAVAQAMFSPLLDRVGNQE